VDGADRWARVERIFQEAIDLPVGERARFLDSACTGDAALRRELESLLARDGPSLLERSALDAAAMAIAQDSPPSWIGRTIHSYEILELLGAGGMGEVYRARDKTLGRDVALKLLPYEMSGDVERLRRLEREARMLASLNDPRIATLYGLEEYDGQRFLVMELVPGQTLAERVRTGALAARDALDICRQIAEGLEAAHDAGIIHRDLKPANVKVLPDGRVKLLDFGLAKVLETPAMGEPTRPGTDWTREGVIVGTPAYMSPEQARGQAVDRRTDIWAFGCCLYETLCGRAAFSGKTTSDTLVAVLDREPDWGALPDRVPARIRQLLQRCLNKDAHHRLQHIGDARLELEESGAERNASPVRRPWRMRSVIAGATLLLAAGATLGVELWRPRMAAPPEASVTRLTLKMEGEIAGSLRLWLNGFSVPFALSPDGARLVFRARTSKGNQLYLRELSGFETRALPGTDEATTPFFSPDGRWIGYWRPEERMLKKVSIDGGLPIEIGPTDIVHAALWAASDEILIETATANQELWSIPAEGGMPRAITVRGRSEGERISLRGVIPGPRRDLLVASIRPDETWLEVLSRETGERRRLLRGGSNTVAHLTRTGHLIYSDADTLFAVPVDPEGLLPVGPPVPAIHGLDHYFWHSNAAVSDSGTLAYVPADGVREAELSWVDRGGHVTPAPGGRAPFGSFALSPNGREVAGELIVGTRRHVWILDLERGTKRLLGSEGDNREPMWSRDGRFITYASNRGADIVMYRKRADGTGAEERLFVRRSGYTSPEDWSPDGQSLLFTEYSSRGDADVWIYSGGAPMPFLAGPSNEDAPRFSPDGKFVAFAADDGGVSHVYVQPFPGPASRTTVSTEDSGSPRWSADGRQLYYIRGTEIMVVPVQTDPVLRIGTPQRLVEDENVRGFDLAPDGRRFLFLFPRSTDRPIELRVVLNWFEELERLAPHPQR
jgi:Tol biopolymer transport system component/predicted Ser/Thr protein kinase